MIQKVQKVQNWLKQTAQKIKNWFKVVWQRQRQKKPTTPTEITFRIGWLIFWGLGIIGVGMTLFSPPLGLALLGVNLIYLGTCLYELKDPDVAFLFRRGKFVGELKSGWYLPIPYFWTITSIPTSWQEKELIGEMYTKEKTPIIVKARTYYCVHNLQQVLLLMPGPMERRVEAVVFSALRGVIGNNEFAKLVEEKGRLEGEVLDFSKPEIEKYGYELRDVEIYDFEEKIWSEAEKIKVLGRARGEAAKALAEPLKDNYPAALVSALGTLAESGERITKTIWGKEKKETKEAEARETEGIGEKLAEAARQITGKK